MQEHDVFKEYAEQAFIEDSSNVDTLWKNKDKAWVGKDSTESVNHPAHYNHGNIETIDYIKEIFTDEMYYGFCIGNCIKYLSRALYKHETPLEDLKKAAWYLNKEIEELEK